MGEELFPLKSGGYVKRSPRETTLCGNCYFKPGGPGTDCICVPSKFVDNKMQACGDNIFKFVEVDPSVPQSKLIEGGKYIIVDALGCDDCCFRTEGGNCCKPTGLPDCAGKQFRKGPNYLEPSPSRSTILYESNYVKIPFDGCDGCVFGDINIKCNKPDNFSGCGSLSNNDQGVIFKLKSDYLFDLKQGKEPSIVQTSTEFISDGVAYRRVPDEDKGTCNGCSFWRDSQPHCKHGNLQTQCSTTNTIFKPACATSEPVSEEITKEILERDYYKVRANGCSGCALQKNDRCIVAGKYIRTCSDAHNSGISMQYRLNAKPAPKVIEPSGIYRLGTELKLENGDTITVRAEREFNSCDECCFDAGDCSKEKYGFDFTCHRSGVIFTGNLSVPDEDLPEKASDSIEEEEVLEEPIDSSIGDFFTTKNGVSIVACSDHGKPCHGCYFTRSGEGCTQLNEMGREIYCYHIVFKNKPDEPNEEEEELLPFDPDEDKIIEPEIDLTFRKQTRIEI